MTVLSGHTILTGNFVVTGLISVSVVCGVALLSSGDPNKELPKSKPKLRLAIVVTTIAVFAVLCLGILLIAARASRDPGHPPFMTWAGLRHTFGRIFATEDQDKLRISQFAAIEPIDAHTHITQSSPEFIAMLQRLHMHVLDILYVNDRAPYRAGIEPQKQDTLNFIASSMGHAQLCTTFDPFAFNNPSFSHSAIDGLNQDFQHGAIAVKVWKNIGMEIKNSSGEYLKLDDPLFQPIYRDIAAHNRTLIVHAADPDAAWTAKYATAASAKYYADNPEWDMSKKPDAPPKSAILDARDHVIAMNPDLRVIGAHFGSMEAQLGELGERLDRYPNFAVDTATRVERLTLQPRDQVLAFLVKYQDRILYGSDLSFDPDTAHKDVAAKTWEQRYLLDWRYFSTDDTFDYHGHQVEGLNLPRTVLEKLYHENAIRWIPGIAASAH